jgi:hypothetical protein
MSRSETLLAAMSAQSIFAKPERGQPRATIPLRWETRAERDRSYDYSLTARAAMAFSISALTADMLKLASACIGGKSMNDCASLPSTC